MRQGREIAGEEHFHSAPLAKKRLERHHEIAGKLVVYASTEAHSSIEKGCRLAMVELHQLRGDPLKDYAVTEEILEKAIQEDLARGLIPCMLHVILGSTSSVVYDDLARIAPVAKRHGMWVCGGHPSKGEVGISRFMWTAPLPGRLGSSRRTVATRRG